MYAIIKIILQESIIQVLTRILTKYVCHDLNYSRDPKNGVRTVDHVQISNGVWISSGRPIFFFFFFFIALVVKDLFWELLETEYNYFFPKLFLFT